MKIYNKLKQIILSGFNLEKLTYTNSFQDLESQVEKFLQTQVISENQINVLFHGALYHLDLEKENYGLNENHVLWYELNSIEKNMDENLKFNFKVNNQVFKISNNFYMINNCLQNLKLTLQNSQNNNIKVFSGLGFKLTYPLILNIILKMDNINLEVDFNTFINDQELELNYIDSNNISYKIVNQQFSVQAIDFEELITQTNPNEEIMQTQNLELKKETETKKVEILNDNDNEIEDLFALFNKTKKEKTKIKI